MSLKLNDMLWLIENMPSCEHGTFTHLKGPGVLISRQDCDCTLDAGEYVRTTKSQTDTKEEPEDEQ